MKDGEFADGIVAILHGVDYLLGGKHDYTCGIDYKNDVFETRNFWIHSECRCDYEERAYVWEDEHPHADDCYQSLIRELGFSYEGTLPYKERDARNHEACYQACDALGIDREEPGLFVHCTCGNTAAWVEWQKTNGHTCDIDEPHFRHFDSGLDVRWYKRVGRSTESNFSMKDLDWYRIVVECLESLKDEKEEK